MSEWIEAREASRRVKAAGLTEGDVIEWARQRKLRARARSGTFSSDDPCEERQFPREPLADEMMRLTFGPWPDIPADYWGATLSKAFWGPGTFAATVSYWEDYHQDYVGEYIELFNVTFSKDDLEVLLNGPPLSAALGEVPKVQWRQQRVSPAQAEAFKFIDIATMKPLKDPLGPVALHRRYREWHGEPKNKTTGHPLKRTAFTKCLTRYREGWRVDGHRWCTIPRPRGQDPM